jgi:large subunit ribosomal protein L31e
MTETKKTEKIEREYIIPLRKRVNIVPRYKRTNKAVKTVKEFLARHMKIRDRDLDKIKIDKYLNEVLWARGIKNPVSKIKVKATKEGDIVRAELAEVPERIKFKKLREEKVENAAKKIAKKKTEEKKEEEKVEENPEAKEEKAEEKKKEEEKKESVIEAGKEIEKAAAKTEKHTTKVQSPKQEKNQMTGYNRSSRGH